MNDIIGWWSGGVTSGITCKLIIDIYGLDRVRLIFIDTKNEDDDTYRFKKDCEQFYGKKIETITAIGKKYNNIQEVWTKHKSLNVAHGAICSSELKMKVRQEWEKTNAYTHQAFGFDIKEIKRATAIKLNHAHTNPIFPLLMYGYEKQDCINIFNENNIRVPRTYELGFQNNNCFKTGCVQGGIGYWQKMKDEYPEKFNAMADMEHKLTNMKGKPVTLSKDQSKKAKESDRTLVFLKAHPDYPELKDISQMKGRPPEPLLECNGFCGTNDLSPQPAQSDINYESNFEFDFIKGDKDER